MALVSGAATWLLRLPPATILVAIAAGSAGREMADKGLPVLRIAADDIAPSPVEIADEPHPIAPSAIPVAAIGPADEPDISLVEHVIIAQLSRSGHRDEDDQSTLITNPFGYYL